MKQTIVLGVEKVKESWFVAEEYIDDDSLCMIHWPGGFPWQLATAFYERHRFTSWSIGNSTDVLEIEWYE